jgi:diguanylate cyclase (GGDEF)-like protein
MEDAITLTFDFILVGAGGAAVAVAWKVLRGRMSRGIAATSVGLVIQGFAHVSETYLGIWFEFVGAGLPEIVHRVLVFAGFAALVAGIVRIGHELRREMDALQAANAELLAMDDDLRMANNELRQRNQQLVDARARAVTDGLTGMLNHRAFQEKVREEVRSAEQRGDCVGLIMLDIDGFKQINDTLGHQQGDRILHELAISISDLVGRKSTFRYGGDEFALLLPSASDSEIARTAEALRLDVASRFSSSQLTISLGWASYPRTGSSAEQIIYGADAAMYRAKGAGKNCVQRCEVGITPSRPAAAASPDV